MEETRPFDKQKERIQQKRKKLRILYVGAAVLACVTVGFLLYTYANRTFAGYHVLYQTELPANMTDCKLGNGVLLLYSNDGAKALKADGSAAWEMSYQLDNPEIAFCHNVAAVADIGGTSVYVVAENGIPYNYNVLYPIVKHEVAGQGVTAVLLDNGTEDFIQLYDINGKLRVDINTKTKTDGIPVDIALSEDGQKLVTLYVTFQGNSICSKVTFYNAGEVGKNYIGNIVGQKTFDENILAYDVGFLNEEYVYVLYENGFSVYHMREVPEQVCSHVTENEILDIAVTEKGLYLIEKDMAGQTKLCYYTVEGQQKRTWNRIPEYESVTATEEEIIFFSPQSITVYRANHSLKFEQTFTVSLKDVFSLGGNKYFLVREGQVQTIKLSDNKQEEGE